MNGDNFTIYVDRDGKMPQLAREPWSSPSHPYYVRYQNGKPVARHGPLEILAQDVTNTKIWDYSQKEFVPLEPVPAE